MVSVDVHGCGGVWRESSPRYAGRNSLKPWANTEVRVYTFKAEDDDEASVVLVDEVVKEGKNEPTSSTMEGTA